MNNTICYIRITKGTTAHKGLTRIRIEKPTVPVKYQGGFSYMCNYFPRQRGNNVPCLFSLFPRGLLPLLATDSMSIIQIDNVSLLSCSKSSQFSYFNTKTSYNLPSATIAWSGCDRYKVQPLSLITTFKRCLRSSAGTNGRCRNFMIPQALYSAALLSLLVWASSWRIASQETPYTLPYPPRKQLHQSQWALPLQIPLQERPGFPDSSYWRSYRYL